MLRFVIYCPDAFAVTRLTTASAISPEALDRCALLETLLREAVKGHVLLVDRRREIERDIARNVTQWPNEFRTYAQDLLTQLRDLGRFVAASGEDQDRAAKCGPAAEAARYWSTEADAILVPSQCDKTASMNCWEEDAIPINHYNHVKKLDSGFDGIYLGGRGEDTNEFRDGLRRLFRHARSVDLFDAYVGESLRLAKTGAWKLVPQKRLGLERILREFPPGRPELMLSVVTVDPWIREGGSSGRAPNEVEQAEIRAAFQRIAWELSRKSSRHVRFYVVPRRPDPRRKLAALVHSRYLVTDQAALRLDRGTDDLLPMGEEKADGEAWGEADVGLRPRQRVWEKIQYFKDDAFLVPEL